MLKIRYYSTRNEAPEFNTPDASGFDIRASLHNNPNNIITRDYLKLMHTKGDKSILNLYNNQTIQYQNLIPFKLFYRSIKNAIDYYKYLEEDEYQNFYNEFNSSKEDSCSIILPYSHNIIKTGLTIELPEGIDATIRPRSGISAKTNMTIMLGTIDSDYRGDWGIIIQNNSPFTYFIIPGERIAQGIINTKEKIEFIQVENPLNLNKTYRGENGFGSSGTK